MITECQQQLEVSSFFNQGVWSSVDLETFKRMVKPIDDKELDDMLEAMANGRSVLSVFGISKFRIKPNEKNEAMD